LFVQDRLHLGDHKNAVDYFLFGHDCHPLVIRVERDLAGLLVFIENFPYLGFVNPPLHVLNEQAYHSDLRLLPANTVLVVAHEFVVAARTVQDSFE
jgi:hypothetical protein